MPERIETGQVWRFRSTGNRVRVTTATKRTIGWASLHPSACRGDGGGGPRDHFLAMFELETEAPEPKPARK